MEVKCMTRSEVNLIIIKEEKKAFGSNKKSKQGRIHGNPVADGWAGAVVRKPLGIQKCYETDRPNDRRTDRHGRV